MALKDEITELDVLKMGLGETYQVFSFYNEDIDLGRDARYGINGLMFDIHDWLDGGFLLKRKSGLASSMGRKYDIQDINTELERRQNLMKKKIIEINFQKPRWMKPRET